MNPDPAADPDLTPDPTSFFIGFKYAKKYFFSHFFITCQQAHNLQSKKFNFLQKILCKNFILQSAQHMKGKGKDPDPYL
jgi:hypothetical protein